MVLSLIIMAAITGLWAAVDSWRTDWVEASTNQMIEANSQTLALIEPVRATDLSLARGGGDITVLADGVLVSESSPLGVAGDNQTTQPAGDQISIYVVKPGETLSEIAAMFEVSVNTIVWANDLSHRDKVKPGQVLVILPVSGIRHTVATGDTVESIAKKYQGQVSEIIQYNNLIDNQLALGDEVMIPYGVAPTPPPTVASSRPGRVVSQAAPTYAGYYMRPIRGGVRTQGLHGYNAVDLASVFGAEIYASAAGRVVISRVGGWNGGYGNYIVIEHPNGTQTLYAHLSQNIVSAGQSVVQGQVIGYMGSTGRSTGPHVHFEIRGATNPF